MAERLEAVVSGLGPWVQPPESSREAWLRDATWVMVLLETVGEEAAGRLDGEEVEEAAAALRSDLVALASPGEVERWARAVRLDQPIRRSFLAQLGGSLHEPLVSLARTVFLIGVELSVTESYREEPGPIHDRWLDGSIDELAWLAATDPTLGATLDDAVARLRGLRTPGACGGCG